MQIRLQCVVMSSYLQVKTAPLHAMVLDIARFKT